jgi:hypothetical protein
MKRTLFVAVARHLPTLVATLALAGCAVPFPGYSISSNNVLAIRGTQRSVELGDFLGNQTTSSCRLRKIGPDADRTFAQYIRAAFTDELVIAGPPPLRERSTVSVRITDVNVDCGNIWSSWTIEGEVRITNQLPYKVKVVRDFDGSFLADVVWARANQAFVPTVQEFIAAIMANPAYRSEFTVARPTPAPAPAPVQAAAQPPAAGQAPAPGAAPAAPAPSPAPAPAPRPAPEPIPPGERA